MSTEQPQQRDTTEPDGPARRQRAELVERLFREHNDALIRFLVARLRSYQDARDVAQESYVRLLSLDEPGAVSYLRAFLFKTAANLATDAFDGRARICAQPSYPCFTSSLTCERRSGWQRTGRRCNASSA